MSLQEKNNQDLQAISDMISEGSPPKPQKEQSQIRKTYEVYVAGALFNLEEDSHNFKLARKFRDAGYTVFNPKVDGIEGSQSDLDADKLTLAIFDLDSKRVLESTIFVANLNGSQVDDETAVEIGIAAASQIYREKYGIDEGPQIMIAYFNDTRCLTPNMDRNPMTKAPFLKKFNKVFSTREEIVEYAIAHFPPQNPNKVAS